MKIITAPVDSDDAYMFDYNGKTNGSEGAKSDWLEDGDTIATYDLTADPAITLHNDSLINGATSVQFWATMPAARGKYEVNCFVHTAGGRDFPATIVFDVFEN